MSQNLVDFFFFEFLFRSKQGCFGYFFLKKNQVNRVDPPYP
jgi:hypothetical protein